MNEREKEIWKYIALILALMLATSIIATTLLYLQNSELQKGYIFNKTTSAKVEVRNQTVIVSTGNITALQAKIDELQQEIEYLKEQLREKQISKNVTNATIAIVPIFGPIDEYTALDLIPKLRAIAKNNSIEGVLLWIDSPGGYVGPVRELYREVKKLSYTKPVVAYTGGTMASGAYFIACGADKIIADPLADVGSIGVIYVHYDLEQNYERNGIKVEVFKTGPYKDMGAEWRSLTDEEKKIISNMIDAYFTDFLNAVSAGRNMTINETKKFATGRTWFALNVTGTLIDETGNIDYSIKVLKKMMNTSSVKVIIYKGNIPVNFGVYQSMALYMDPRYISMYIKR
ncbi:signal peptide peptidase SppA [Thermococcus sp.]